MTCPATGRRLKSCQLAPNIDFRSALEAWVQSATGSDVGADKASNQQPPRPGHPQSGRAATGKITHASTPPRPKSHRESARSARAGIVVHGVVRPSSAVADNQRGSAHRFRDSPPQQSAAVDNQLHHPSSHISPSRHQSPLANRQVSSPDRRSGEPRGLETSLSYGATAVRSKFWSPRRSRLVGQEHPSQHQTQGSSSGDADGVEPRMCHARGILPGPLDRVQRSSSPSSRGIRSSLDVTLRSWLGKAESLLGSIALNNGAKGTSSHVQTSAADLNASGSTNLSGSADSVSSISSLGSIVTLESSAEKDLPVGSERVIHGMLQVVADKELPAEDRVAALEVLRDVTHGAPAEISSAMNRSGGIQVLSAVLAQSEKDHCAVSALALQIVTNLTEDPGCLSSTLRAKLPAQAIHMLGFSDGDVSASAAKLVAALARQGGSAAESVADSSAMLPLVKMLQDGSTLSARAAAGCAIEELMKGGLPVVVRGALSAPGARTWQC